VKDDSSLLPAEMEHFADAVNDFGEPIDGVANEFMGLPLPDISESTAEMSKLETEAENVKESGKEEAMEVEEEDGEKQTEAAAPEGGDKGVLVQSSFCCG